MRMIQVCLRILVVLMTLAGAVGIIQPLDAAPAKTAWLNNFEVYASTKFHCSFTNEDVVGDGQWGVSGVRIPLPPVGITKKGLVPFLTQNLPDYKVWRDRVYKSVIHIADRRLLNWKNNPLNKKLTFHGKMTIVYLQSHILQKDLPNVHFDDSPYTPQVAIPYFPDLQAFQTPMRFNVQDLTLRRFLTTGLRYSNKPNKRGALLWFATYQFRDGKLTGHVQVCIQGNPIFPPPTATRANGHNK